MRDRESEDWSPAEKWKAQKTEEIRGKDHKWNKWNTVCEVVQICLDKIDGIFEDISGEDPAGVLGGIFITKLSDFVVKLTVTLASVQFWINDFRDFIVAVSIHDNRWWSQLVLNREQIFWGWYQHQDVENWVYSIHPCRSWRVKESGPDWAVPSYGPRYFKESFCEDCSI